MARTPVGTRPQAIASSAVAAHIASRLTGLGSDRAERDAWLGRELGLKLRSNGLERAALRARPALTAWVLVDERRVPLDVSTALVVFPGRGRVRPRLIAGLRSTGSVRQLIVTRSRRDVICVLLHRHGERDHLFDAVDALGEAFVWEDVVEEDRAVEADAWTALTIRFAEEEALTEGE
jgi:hypothetical protein